MKQTELKKSTGLLSLLKEKFQHPEFVFWSLFALWIMLALMLAVFLGVMFFECVSRIVTCWLGTKETEVGTSKYETLKFIGLGMSGMIVTIGAIAINRRATAEAENNKLIEKGHIDERFRSAIENLKDDDPVIRISAFHQFYYLAKHSDVADFRKNIFDVLCAYLRHKFSNKNKELEIEGKKITEECQTLLNVLFCPDDKSVFKGLKADLGHVYLAEAILANADLANANLLGAYLSGANLSRANLANANLVGTNISLAIISLSNLSGANLSGANLFHSILSGSNLLGANLAHTDFWGAQLENGQLDDVRDVVEADFRGAMVDGKPISREQIPNDKGEYYADWAPLDKKATPPEEVVLPDKVVFSEEEVFPEEEAFPEEDVLDENSKD